MDTRPELLPDLESSYEIFWELSPSRNVDSMTGFVGSIPYYEISAYFRLYRIKHYDKLLERIKIIDRIYRGIINGRHRSKP